MIIDDETSLDRFIYFMDNIPPGQGTVCDPRYAHISDREVILYNTEDVNRCSALNIDAGSFQGELKNDLEYLYNHNMDDCACLEGDE